MRASASLSVPGAERVVALLLTKVLQSPKKACSSVTRICFDSNIPEGINSNKISSGKLRVLNSEHVVPRSLQHRFCFVAENHPPLHSRWGCKRANTQQLRQCKVRGTTAVLASWPTSTARSLSYETNGEIIYPGRAFPFCTPLNPYTP